MPKPDRRIGEHAVVIGGSVGGLFSARVLSDYFDRVTIVDRDKIPDSPEPRKNIPQGRHVHALFGGGVHVIKTLFPNFFEELVAAGAVPTDFARDLCWHHQGVWKLRTESGLVSYWQTRPFLEHHLRRRTRAIPNIEFREQCEVTRLLADADKARIVGVEIEDRKNGGVNQVSCDLVIHAGGRGSRVIEWIQSLDYDKPEEQIVEINIGYASRFYERPPGDTRDWEVLATFAMPPDRTRSGYLFPVEGGRWLATMVGFAADYPRADDASFLQFAQSLEVPDVYAAIRDAKPLSPIATYQFPAHRWNRFDRLSRFPEGLIVLGDAVCSFNPVYGQGMSVCALQAELLDRMMQRGSELRKGFGRDFHRKAAKIIAVPWLLATTSDFLFAGTKGAQSLKSRILKRYIARVFKLCASNRNVLLSFYRVLHFLDKPAVLFRPSIVASVAASTLGLMGRSSGKNRPTRP